MKGDCMARISKVETGKKIRKLLAEYGLTVRDIQEELELDSPQSVYKWLNGKALPSLENLMVLSRVLDVPMEKILAMESADEKEVAEKRMRWIKKHPPVMRAYRFTGSKRLEGVSLLIFDTKTDWPQKKRQYALPKKKRPGPKGTSGNT